MVFWMDKYGIVTGRVTCFCTMRHSQPGSIHNQQELPALHRAPKLIPT